MVSADTFGVQSQTASSVRTVPAWKRWSLLIAGTHCILWGIFVILLPDRSALVYGFSGPLTDWFLWQGTGLIIMLLGCGYCVASADPERHYLIVLVGLLAKILGTIGLLWCVSRGQVPSAVLLLIPVNDLIWWYPFSRIVLDGYKTP